MQPSPPGKKKEFRRERSWKTRLRTAGEDGEGSAGLAQASVILDVQNELGS
jgi:hypothetical protein